MPSKKNKIFLILSCIITSQFLLLSCKKSNSRILESYRLRNENGKAASHISNIPNEGLPYGWVMRNLEGFLEYKREISNGEDPSLFGNRLHIKEDQLPWNTTFWPEMLNGVAARWQESSVSNFLGYQIHRPQTVFRRLLEAKKGNKKSQKWMKGLSPIEKYDLAVGDYNFSATTIELSLRGELKNETSATWEGFCNGIAAAAMKVKEPRREIKIINPEGFEITFYPNDIKALMALAYYNLTRSKFLGDRCDEENPQRDEKGRIKDLTCRDVNPGALFIALLNRIGVAQSPFAFELDKTAAVWNYPIVDTKISFIPFDEKMYPISTTKADKLLSKPGKEFLDKVDSYLIDYDNAEIKAAYPHAAENTSFLIHVQMDITLSDQGTHAGSNLLIPGSIKGLYQPSTLVKKDVSYTAIIEMDEALNILGGEWTGDSLKGDGETSPDFVWFAGNPQVNNKGHLKANQKVSYEVLQAFHAKSLETESEEIPTLKLPEHMASPSKTLEGLSSYSGEKLKTDQIKIINWKFSLSSLKIAGKVSPSIQSQATKIVLHDVKNKKIAEFPVNEGLFSYEESWYFLTPPKSLTISLFNQSDQLLFKTPDLPTSLQTDFNHISVVEPIHQDIFIRDKQINYTGVFQFFAPSRPELKIPAGAALVREARGSLENPLTFPKTSVKVSAQKGSLQTLVIREKLEMTTTDLSLVFLDKTNEELTDHQDVWDQQHTVKGYLSLLPINIPFAHNQDSSYSTPHLNTKWWTKERFRNNYPLRFPLKIPLIFTHYSPGQIVYLDEQKFRFSAEVLAEIKKQRIKVLTKKSIRREPWFKTPTNEFILAIRRYGRVAAQFKVTYLKEQELFDFKELVPLY